MGKPVRIVDLARDLITLSGLRPSDDIEIRFSGVRPGEKLFEELMTDAEHADKTRHPKVFIGHIKPTTGAVAEGVSALVEIASRGQADQIRAVLADLVPEYRATRPQRIALKTGESLALPDISNSTN
jgi:O-antigen biosynthesis protein WbqV